MSLNKNINSFRRFFDQSTIQILYSRYKEYFLPAGILFCSAALFFFAIIPQIQSFFSYRQQEKVIKEKIGVLQKNINFLSSFDDADLDSKLQTVSLALPPEKDFILVMQAISKASSVAGVGLADFSFEIGQVSGNDPSSLQKTASLQNQKSPARPALQITLIVNGGLEQAKQFVKELKNTLPLSEVSQIDSTDNASTVNVAFYYKPLPPVNLDEQKALQPLSQKDVEFIDKLRSLTNN